MALGDGINDIREARKARKQAEEARKARARQFEELDRQAESLYETSKSRLKREQEYRDRAFGNMLDQQMRMLGEFYSATSESAKESWADSIKDQQGRLQDMLDDMDKAFKQSQRYMSKQDKLAYEVMYKNRVADIKALQDEITSRAGDLFNGLDDMFDDLQDDVDDLSKSWSERLSEMGDELRDWANTLNLDALVSSVQDAVDNVYENQRQIESVTGNNFNSSSFTRSVDSLNKSIAAYDRSQASELISNIMKDFGINDVGSAADYMKTMAGAEILGMSKDDLGNLMWKDMGYGVSGKMVRTLGNMAMSLDEADGLYVHQNTILSKLNENADAILGIAGKYSERTLKMQKSLANLEALSETEANEGVDNMVSMLQEFQKLSLPEMYNNDQATTFAGLMGISIQELSASVNDPEKLGKLIGAYQTKLGSMGDNELYAWKDELGFDYVYQMRELVGVEGLMSDYQKIMSTTNSAVNMSENDATLDMMANSSNETVTAIQEMKNAITSNPIVTWFSKVMDTIDISMADLANVTIVGSALFKGGSAIVKAFQSDGIISKLGSSLSSIIIGSGVGGAAGAGAGGAAGAGLSKAAVVGLSVAPGLAVLGSGLYGMSQSVGAGKSVGREFSDKSYGRGLAYGADSALLMGAGVTTAAAGVSGISAAVGAAAGGAGLGTAMGAGLAAIGPVGWVAGALLAVGLGTKAILDNTKKVNGFAKGIGLLEDDMKDSIHSVISSQQDQLVSIKESLKASDGAVEDINLAKDQLISSGISSEIVARMNSVSELEEFTQQLINASSSAESFANMKIGEDIKEATSELKSQFDNKKRKEFIKSAYDLLGKRGSAAEGTAEWDKTKRFLDTLAESMDAGEARDNFVKAYTTALSSHGGISKSELGALLGDKGMGSGIRALFSKDIDLKKSYFDNVTDYSNYNAIVDTYLGGKDSLRIDTSKVDALVANTPTVSMLSGYYETWKNNKDTNVDVADQYKYQYAQLLSTFKSTQGYDEYFKAELEDYAREMGIEGYKRGLSYVPNDGLALIHKGEAVLTASQADTVRAQADGGIDVLDSETSSKVNSLASTVDTLVSTISSGMSTVDSYYSKDKKANKELVRALSQSGLFGIKLGSLASRSNIFTTIASALVGGDSSSTGGVLGNLVRGVKGIFGKMFGGSTSAGTMGYTGDMSIKSADTSGLVGNKKDFIDRIKPGALEAYKQYHVLPSLTLAQGVLESGWGKHSIGNNLFGIKAGSNWNGKTQTVRTAEYDSSGRKYYVNAAFRDYASIDESILDHARLLTNGRYANVLSANNYKEAAKAVQAAGYATDPNYASSLIGIIESNGLNAWDNQYAKGTPWLPNDQVALVHEGEMIVPADNNPFGGEVVNVGADSDNSDVIETLKWMVSRLENKLDAVIAASLKSNPSRRGMDSTDLVNTFMNV